MFYVVMQQALLHDLPQVQPLHALPARVLDLPALAGPVPILNDHQTL
jgi:hypothetical protein